MDSIGHAAGFQFFFLLLFLVPLIFFLITLQKTMTIISIENRKMNPSHVWFMLIPIFNIVWQFIMVSRIAESIGEECIRLHISDKNAKPTYRIGLTWNICNLITFIPIIGALAALISWIAYWVKVNEFKNLMLANKDNFLLDAERNIFYEGKN
ncbi:MAG: hypothetical protein M3Z56_04905 [Bacteroidota bacterium]|nr:hypothetical protein [Bacteroidota bacterium]